MIYWTSERGAVVSARALDGPPELQKAAAEAMYKWKFKPMSVNGQPVQMGSAVVVDFSQTPAGLQVPKPMTAAQLSQLERQYVQKRLWERYNLPRLSLFYLT